jgi:hypothetical protein
MKQVDRYFAMGVLTGVAATVFLSGVLAAILLVARAYGGA